MLGIASAAAEARLHRVLDASSQPGRQYKAGLVRTDSPRSTTPECLMVRGLVMTYVPAGRYMTPPLGRALAAAMARASACVSSVRPLPRAPNLVFRLKVGGFFGRNALPSATQGECAPLGAGCGDAHKGWAIR